MRIVLIGIALAAGLSSAPAGFGQSLSPAKALSNPPSRNGLSGGVVPNRFEIQHPQPMPVVRELRLREIPVQSKPTNMDLKSFGDDNDGVDVVLPLPASQAITVMGIQH